MKHLALTLIALAVSIVAQAQDIFNEVRSLQKNYQALAEDTTQNIDKRKIAVFKADALYYLTEKAAQTDNFTEYKLGMQANAMIDFVNLFVKRISSTRKASEQEVLKAKFKSYTTSHSLFNDMEKEITYAYIDNDDFITQFSLDTDWVEALNDARKPSTAGQ